MPDNTTLNVGTAGDVIRDVLKGAVKTPVCIIDVGGAGVEVLLTAGQQTMAASVPVVIASNQTAVPVTANVGTTGGLALDATLTGGTQVCQAVGNVVHDAVDSGAPAKVGGKANSGTPTAVAIGDRVDAWYGLNGQQMSAIVSSTSPTDSGQSGLCLDPGGASRAVGAAGMAFNSAAWDRLRNNHEITVLASAARTAAINSSDQTNYNARMLYLTWDITAAATGTLTLTIKYKDSLSGKYVTLLASTAQTGVGTVTLKVGPDLTAAANTVAKEALPRVWRAEVTGSDGSSWTYSVSANYSL